MHVHMYMNLRVCLSVRVSVYMYVCTYIYKFACLYATVALERLTVLDASLQHPGQPQPVLADLCQISAVKLACESLCVCGRLAVQALHQFICGVPCDDSDD